MADRVSQMRQLTQYLLGCDATRFIASGRWNRPVSRAESRARRPDAAGSGRRAGRDSSVVAALLHRAIGSRLTCVYVDNGLLRNGDGESGFLALPGW